MKIKLLKKGDRIISVTDNLIAIERASGELDIYHIVVDKYEKKIDTKSKLTIGYEETINTKTVNGVTITTF